MVGVLHEVVDGSGHDVVGHVDCLCIYFFFLSNILSEQTKQAKYLRKLISMYFSKDRKTLCISFGYALMPVDNHYSRALWLMGMHTCTPGAHLCSLQSLLWVPSDTNTRILLWGDLARHSGPRAPSHEGSRGILLCWAGSLQDCKGVLSPNRSKTIKYHVSVSLGCWLPLSLK